MKAEPVDVRSEFTVLHPEFAALIRDEGSLLQVMAPVTPETDASRRLRKLQFEVLLICVVIVVLMALELVGNRVTANRWDWDFREISVVTVSVMVPIVYTILKFFLPWSKHWRSQFGMSPGSATEPGGLDAVERDRQRFNIVVTGFAVGLVLGPLAVGLDLAWKGWRVFADLAVLELIAFPLFGALMALAGTWLPGDPFLPRRRLRFSVLSLMGMVAYLALIFGVIANTRQIGFRAVDYHTKWKIASRSAEFNRTMAGRWQSREFVEWINRQIDYDQALAIKYKRAERHPWERVELDPPRPN